MSRMGALIIDLQEAIAAGESVEVIARNFDVPVRWVLEASDLMDGYCNEDEGLSGLIAEVSGDS